MLAYLIDVRRMEVQTVELSGDYREIYPLIGCETFTCVQINDKNDVIYVDDEGLLKDLKTQSFFMFKGYPQPLAGNGLILGTDDEGGSKSPEISMMEVIKSVSYMTFYQVLRWSREHPDL